jgi:tetratricopeptide (TPR) repeat protein
MYWVRLGWHDNIILAIEVISVGNKPYLVMQYADSGDLASWIREGRMTVALAVSFAVQFCRGMRYAIDTAGLIHRDIKPANILIRDDRILKISDFGLSKAFNSADGQTLDGPSSSDGVLSLAGAGTRPYMAPEQFVSLGQADTRSDIFSFGATLYEMLTSRRLFDQMTAYDMAILGRPPLSARRTNPAVPQPLSEVVDRCVAFDPNRRYQRFAELEADLVEVHGHLPYRIPIPEDSQRPLPAFFGLSYKALGETYALISLGRPYEAIRKAQEGIDCDPDNAEHWINKGKALGDLERFAESRDCFEHAVGLAPWNAIAWSNLGWAHLAMGDAGEGLKHADHAVSLDSTFADAWSCRAACAKNLGQVEKALFSFQRATTLAPENWVAYFNLGCLLADLGRHDEALNALHAAARINPEHAPAWYKIAFSLASQNKTVAALPAIDRSLELDPADAEAWAFRGFLLWQGRGQVEAARHCIDKALMLDSRNQQARTIQAALSEY